MEPIRKHKIIQCGKAPPRELSRSLLAFFALAELCFGFHFGFTKVTCTKYLTSFRVITSLACCLMAFTLSLPFVPGIMELWMTTYLIQYIPTILILFSTKYTLCEFITDLIQEQPPSFKKYNTIGLITWSYCVSMFIVRILAAFFYRLLTNKPMQKVIFETLVHIPILGLDIIPIANFLLFYHVYSRMSDLKTKLEHREIDIQQLQTAYKTVANDFGRFRSKYDAIFVWGLLTDSPKWMCLIWNHLTIMKSTCSWIIRGCSYAWALHLTGQICLSAMFAEMINVQADAMKIILHERLSIETDETKSASLRRLLRYVEARPLLRKAWRLVPVDMRLPIAMLSMCVTYLIVIVQFTHLYD